MKKLLTVLLTCMLLLSLVSCASNGIDNSYSNKEIIKMEVIDDILWVTYKDNPNTPVNMGSIVKNNDATEGLAYTLLSDGTYSVRGMGTATVSDIIVPPTYNGRAVTAVSDKAFYMNNDITSIVIPEGVTYIGEYAFYNCHSITSIIVPDSVTRIGQGAFMSCDKVAEINVPKNLKIIEQGVFSSCTAKVLIPNSVKLIREGNLYYSNSATFTFESWDGWKNVAGYDENGNPILGSSIDLQNILNKDTYSLGEIGRE